MHTICIAFDEQWMEEVDGQESVCTTASTSSTRLEESAINIRNAFMSYFAN